MAAQASCVLRRGRPAGGARGRHVEESKCCIGNSPLTENASAADTAIAAVIMCKVPSCRLVVPVAQTVVVVGRLTVLARMSGNAVSRCQGTGTSGHGWVIERPTRVWQLILLSPCV
ncbi:hypothetical protein GGI06_002896 [Coemansia sp. S85]|nr:hypothetical protein GGI06_002896 [Coemansia sp. S85]